MQEELRLILEQFSEVLSFHDFRIVGKGERENLVFDVVLKRTMNSREKERLSLAITQKVQEKHPCYFCVITYDQNDMLAQRS